MNTEPEATLTAGQIAEALGIHPDTVLKAIKRGVFGPLPTSRKWNRVPLSAVEAYLGRKLDQLKLAKKEASRRRREFILSIVKEVVAGRDRQWIDSLPKRKGFERTPPILAPWGWSTAIVDRHLSEEHK